MIRIELNFETGAEARQALNELLGGTMSVSLPDPDSLKFILDRANRIKDEKIAENFEAPKMEVVQEETATKKRRTKAEIAAEAIQGKVEEALAPDVQSDNDVAETQEEAKAPAVTKEMLQEKAVNLIRNSKKEQVVAVLKKFGADSIAQADKNPLKVEDYPAVMDELNKL